MNPGILQDPGRESVSKMDLGFFAVIGAFLYTQLFQLPFTPYYFDGDHLIPISNAMRLLGGEVMYRDFFHITPPGTELWYAAFFLVFGLKIWVLNFSILVLGLALAWFGWYFSRQLFGGLLVYLASSVVLIVGLRLFFIDGSHRLFSAIFAFAAVGSLLRSRGPRHLALAGFLCGISTFFGQPRGVVALAGIIIFVVWERFRCSGIKYELWKAVAILAGTFAVTVMATQAYFLISAGFDNYYFALVTFIAKYYSGDPLSNSDAFFADIPSLGRYLSIYSAPEAVSRFLRISLPTLLFYALVPWSYLAFLVYRWRKRTYIENDLLDRRLMLLGCVGIALSLGVSAPSSERLSHVAIPAAVILVWLLSRVRIANRIAAALLCLTAVLALAYALQRQTVLKYYLNMPSGRAAFLSNAVFERYKWMGEHTHPGDLFYEGHHPSFYFPFRLKNPTPLYVVRDNNYSPRFQVDSVQRSLEKHPPEFIFWPRKWSKLPQDRKPDDHLENLWLFVKGNYDFQIVFEKPVNYTPNSEGDIEVWKRKAN
ncbi:MAG: hypothetical protein IT174_04265 [Acidobacteria bacterium]|nr:hypothetical protein [Acidobacteriota bacterium]